LAIAVLALIVLPFFLIPCLPWSFKTVIALRSQCINNLKVIWKTLHDRGIPLDAIHSEQVRAVIDDFDFSCPEGSEIHGWRAGYTFVLRG
jgi:hypothetical protein